MNSLVLPKQTVLFIERMSKNQPHALLLIGEPGAGLGAVALVLAKQNGAVLERIEPTAKVEGGSVSISVDIIRDLYVKTRSKYVSPMTVIIEHADTMNHVAQNALLKLLEEPVAHVHFILTSSSPDSLLPTIHSRVQTHTLTPLNDDESRKLIRQQGITDQITTNQIAFASLGLAGRICNLAQNPKMLELMVDQMKLARRFAQGSSYERLAIIAAFKDDRKKSVETIDAIVLLLRYSLRREGKRATVRQMDALLAARDKISANGNVRLQLMDAVLQ